MRKPLPNALSIDLAGGLTEEVTPHAGIALLTELGRRSGVMAAAEKYLPPKKSPKKLGQDQMVEAKLGLLALDPTARFARLWIAVTQLAESSEY